MGRGRLAYGGRGRVGVSLQITNPFETIDFCGAVEAGGGLVGVPKLEEFLLEEWFLIKPFNWSFSPVWLFDYTL